MLWFAAGDSLLSSKARDTIQDSETINYISTASWWEIAIKLSLGKLKMKDPLADFMARRIEEGFRILPIETEHLLEVAHLPFHHRDPFDRLLICQALKENMPICTMDKNFSNYNVNVLW